MVDAVPITGPDLLVDVVDILEVEAGTTISSIEILTIVEEVITGDHVGEVVDRDIPLTVLGREIEITETTVIIIAAVVQDPTMTTTNLRKIAM